MQVSQQKRLQYGRFKYRDMQDDLLLGVCLILEVNSKVNLKTLKDFKYFLISKLVNVSKYDLNIRMYSHNTLLQCIHLLHYHPRLKNQYHCYCLLFETDSRLFMCVCIHLLCNG